MPCCFPTTPCHWCVPLYAIMSGNARATVSWEGRGSRFMASEDIIGRLENKLKEISSITTLLDVGNTPEMILEYVLGEFGLEIGGRLPAAFYCNCTKDRVEKALISVGRKDIGEMIEDGKPIEVNCHFCNKNYTFSVDELKDMLEKSK